MSRGLHDLPKDILHLLFTHYCDPLTAVQCSRVCTKFRRALGNTDKLAQKALVYRLRQEQSALRRMTELRAGLLPTYRTRYNLHLFSKYEECIIPIVPRIRCQWCRITYNHIAEFKHYPESCPLRVVLCKDCGVNMIQARFLYQHPTTCPKRMTKIMKARMVLLQILLGIIKCVQVFVEFWIPDTFLGGVQRFFLAFFIVRIWFRV